MKVLFFWEPVGGLTLMHRCNPYAGLLARALEPHDIHLELGDYGFSQAWLEARRPGHEVLHLHWLQRFYRGQDLASTVSAYRAFAEGLHAARRLGYRIVWTLHNLYPHERPFPEVDHLARLLVADSADAVLAHCEHGARLARERFYCRQVHVVPHGHFIDAYPNEVARAAARARLELPPEAFVYLFFGNARAYKSIESLIDAFRGAAADDALLVLMMRVAFDSEYAARLAERAHGDGRVRVFRSEYFAPEEFQIYLNSADAVVLPFSEVLTSGSTITALGFGRPVIVPHLGCLPELVSASVGITYDPVAPGALAEALRRIRGCDLEAMGRAARERAEGLDWAGIAAQVARIYRG